jgi:hypothetical protein
MNESSQVCCVIPKECNLTEESRRAFWSRVEKRGPDECWPMVGRNLRGYGIISVGGKNCRANRVCWTMHFGAIPSGLWVLHKCDNPACVNPSHLWLGTVHDNNADKISKNRQSKGWNSGAHTKPERKARGEAVKNAKLNNEIVLEIRRKHRAGLRYRQIANDCRTTVSQVAKVITGTSWAHVRL